MSGSRVTPRFCSKSMITLLLNKQTEPKTVKRRDINRLMCIYFRIVVPNFGKSLYIYDTWLNFLKTETNSSVTHSYKYP